MGAADGFAGLYARGYAGLLLTAYALLADDDGSDGGGDPAEAEAVTRDAFAIARQRRAALEAADDQEEWVRAVVVRLARRRLWWRAVRRGRVPVAPGRAAALRLHRLAGLPAETIASIVDTPVATVESWLAGAGDASWVSVRQPAVTRVFDRVRQRAARRRMLAAAAAAVLVLAVVVPLMRVAPEPLPAAAPVPETPPPSGMSADMIYGVTFADALRGYALHADCDSGDCRMDLLSTRDGERWSRTPVPKGGAPRQAMGGLSVLGPDELVVDWAPPETPERRHRVHSTDGGRTWERVSTAVRGTVALIPEGARLEYSCLRLPPWCEQSRVSVLRPGSGESAWLTGPPRLENPQPGNVRAGGKYWWVVGRAPGSRAWTLALSRDSHTWTTARVAWPAGASAEWWSVIEGAGTLYASATGSLNGGDYGLLGIFRSDDGGRSWTRTRGPLRQSLVGDLVAGADGTLTANTQNGTMLVSRDGGRTFGEGEARYSGWAYWTGRGYVSGDESGHAIRYSTDGVRWRELDLNR